MFDTWIMFREGYYVSKGYNQYKTFQIWSDLIEYIYIITNSPLNSVGGSGYASENRNKYIIHHFHY